MIGLEEVEYSYSDNLEDVIAYNFLKERELHIDMTYLDVGVNTPRYFSNTYMFYEMGFRGVLVEPLEECFENIEKFRPEDSLIKGAIGYDDREVRVIKRRGKRGGSSYLTDDKWQGHDNCLECKMYKLNNIISDNFNTYPTFMSIDIEGKELDVLQTLDFKKYPIPVVCSEVNNNLSQLTDFMRSKGYDKDRKTITHQNVIFKRLEGLNERKEIKVKI